MFVIIVFLSLTPTTQTARSGKDEVRCESREYFIYLSAVKQGESGNFCRKFNSAAEGTGSEERKGD